MKEQIKKQPNGKYCVIPSISTTELIKQPNGKYCSISFNGVIQFDNYSEQDIINMYIEQAKRDMENASHFKEIIKRLTHINHNGLGLVDEHRLKSMGFDRPYKELIKFVPLKPTNEHYVGHDCTTYGKCPNCGGCVENGIGFKEEKCRTCSQILKW